jgi:hypothetical protein
MFGSRHIVKRRPLAGAVARGAHLGPRFIQPKPLPDRAATLIGLAVLIAACVVVFSPVPDLTLGVAAFVLALALVLGVLAALCASRWHERRR